MTGNCTVNRSTAHVQTLEKLHFPVEDTHQIGLSLTCERDMRQCWKTWFLVFNFPNSCSQNNSQRSLHPVRMLVYCLSQLIACKHWVSPTVYTPVNSRPQIITKNSTGHYFPATSTVRGCMSVLVDSVMEVAESWHVSLRNIKTNGVIRLLFGLLKATRTKFLRDNSKTCLRVCARRRETDGEKS